MSRFQFELATRDDDEQLRRILNQTAMAGRISLTLQREPSFFEALAIEGPEVQVIACRDQLSGQLVGFGTRSIRQRFVNGKACRVGYLGSLRLLPEYRRLRLLARGYQFFKELAQQDPVAWHFTSITDDNDVALRTLTSGRAGLPIYRRVATLKTLALTRGARRTVDSLAKPLKAEIALRPGIQAEPGEIVDFINRSNTNHNFSLVHRLEDWTQGGQTGIACPFRDLNVDAFQTAWEVDEARGKLIGCLAAWDQSRFKQIVVQTMPASWNWLRPLWNATRMIHGQPALVRAGEKLRSVMAALLAVEPSQPEILFALLKQILTQLNRDEYFLLAIDSRSIFSSQLLSSASGSYQNGIYIVGWDAEQLASYDADRLIAPELGCL